MRNLSRNLRVNPIIFLILILCVLVGCENTPIKPSQDLVTREEFDTRMKQVTENKSAIEGNGNKIVNLNTSLTSVKTTINKKIEQNQETTTKAVKAEFKDFKGTYNTDQDNIHNDMWFVFGVLIIVASTILLIIGSVLAYIYFNKKFTFVGRGSGGIL